MTSVAAIVTSWPSFWLGVAAVIGINLAALGLLIVLGRNRDGTV